MARNDLKRAKKHFKSKKYSDVVNSLEPQVFRFRENFTYFYLLGISCLYLGDFGGASSYLERARQLNPEDTNTKLGLAAVHLKRQETGKAIMNWLSVLEKEKNNTIAKRGLALVKKNSDPDSLSNITESSKITTVYPSSGCYIPRFIYIILLAAVISVFVIIIDFSSLFASISKPALPRNENVSSLSLEQKMVLDSKEAKWKLTETEIEDSFSKAKSYFNSFEDNKAQIEINTILYSNAPKKVKEKAEIIESYLSEPDFSSLKENYSYKEVISNPYHYRNCYVKWKGKISNLSIGEKAITFDLLVGYHEEKVLQGIVPVTLDFATSIDQGSPVEVLGQIILRNSSKVALRGVGIHPLSPEKTTK